MEYRTLKKLSVAQFWSVCANMKSNAGSGERSYRDVSCSCARQSTAPTEALGVQSTVMSTAHAQENQ
jgi:hypothetical protein